MRTRNYHRSQLVCPHTLPLCSVLCVAYLLCARGRCYDIVFESALDRITKDVMTQFDRDGYYVLDNFFGPSLSAHYRKGMRDTSTLQHSSHRVLNMGVCHLNTNDNGIEIQWLYANEAMLANCTATMKRDDGVKSLSQKFVKPGSFVR